jgi:hypothetical protein
MIRVEQHQHDVPCQRLAWDPGITGLGISLTVMIRVEQHQHDVPCQRLAWDPGITGLGISLTDGDEQRLQGEVTLIFH